MIPSFYRLKRVAFTTLIEFITTPIKSLGENMKVTKVYAEVSLLYFTFFLVVDHILLVEADSNLIETIEINENEVAAIKFVPISQLNCLDQLELTPWLQKILKIDALGKWIDEFKDLSSNSSSNYMNSMIITTKYSTGPIIKLS